MTMTGNTFYASYLYVHSVDRFGLSQENGSLAPSSFALAQRTGMLEQFDFRGSVFWRSPRETGYDFAGIWSTSSIITFHTLSSCFFRERRIWDWSLSAPWLGLGMPECQTAVLFSTPFVGHDCSPFGEGFPTLEKNDCSPFLWISPWLQQPISLWISPCRAVSQVCRLLCGAWLLVRASSGDGGVEEGDWLFHLNIITFLSLQVGGCSRNDISFNIGNMLNLIWDDDPKWPIFCGGLRPPTSQFLVDKSMRISMWLQISPQEGAGCSCEATPYSTHLHWVSSANNELWMSRQVKGRLWWVAVFAIA